ncbi:MAG TPA: transglycosylase SLT domain-containing protein [Ramlibacter sp.]|nr:transglycosylase SLT domain-containing protein [Ramlibacter sp.]
MKLSPLACAVVLLALAACATSPQQPAPVDSVPPIAKAIPSAGPVGPIAPPAASVIPGGDLTPIASIEVQSKNVALLVPPADLWERVRRGFKMKDLQNDYVRQQEQYYLRNPEYIGRMTERSRKYMFHIVEELERRDMPTELALLPFVESAFNPQAMSSAKAAGMWQFIPSTGRVFDLKQNVFRDDRRDVLASTRAALDYLQKLHGMFGDWQLALAAYNWGEGSVGRAIARNQKQGLGTTYAELSMPNETRWYVPKLQALKNIVANPDAYNAELPVIGNHPYFQTVTLSRDIDVKLAAQLADVPIEDFKALNPSMNRPVILANGTGQILLPWDNATIFQRNFEAYTAGQYASWTAWKVPANMNPAEAARRTGMSETDLRAINTIPPRMLIKAGSVLIVPRSSKMQADVSDDLADNAQLNLQSEMVTRKMTVKAGKKDTVASIARRYKVSTKQVAEWNSTTVSGAFHAGQQVVVYVPVRTAKASHTRKGATHAKGASTKKQAASAKKPAKTAKQ